MTTEVATMGSAPHAAKPPKPILAGIIAYDMGWKKGLGSLARSRS